jgi:hypothetical protein
MDIIVHVITNAKKTEIVEEREGFLKIKLNALPIKGKANTELVKFLADKYKVSKSEVEIIKGLTSKDKLIRIYR